MSAQAQSSFPTERPCALSIQNAWTTGDFVCIGVILAVLALVALPQITVGGLGWSDAPNHTFDGIFILELLRQRPWGHFRDWAEQFYLHYPSLGIVVYYPPGFAIAEAGVFALSGVNIVSARATVVLFAAGAAVLLFLLCRRWFDRWTGLFAALLLITCPHGAMWMRDVMLEWPATFWVLASVYAYEKSRHSARWSVAMCLCLIMAYMTKQTAGFIIPVIVFHAAISGQMNRRFLTATLVAFLVIGGYQLWASQYAALPSQLLTTELSARKFTGWAPEILGWPLLGISILGMLTMALRPDRGTRSLLLLWFAIWTGFSMCISAKEPRYLFFAIVPLCIAAPRFLMRDSQGICWPVDRARITMLALLVGAQYWLTSTSLAGPLPSYAPAVSELIRCDDADIVLIDAVRDGQFAFDIYQDQTANKKLIPLRASKLLYARAAREKYSYEQFVNSPADIVSLLERYGIRYIVIESRLPNTPYVDADPPPRKMLRELLQSDTRFKLIKKWPLRCNDPAWDDVELCLYSYPRCPARSTKEIEMSFPSMKRRVILKIP